MWYVNSLVVAWEIEFLNQEWNPGSLHWECGVLVTGPPGKSLQNSLPLTACNMRCSPWATTLRSGEMYPRFPVDVLQGGGPLQGLKGGSYLTWIIQGDTRADRDFIGKGCAWAESRRVREPRRTALPLAHSLRFYGDGLVSGLSLSSHSDSRSFVVAQALFSQDGWQWEGF